MKALAVLPVSLALCATAQAVVVPFNLSVKGNHFDHTQRIEISDLGEGKTQTAFQFKDKQGNPYSFDLKYSALPGNRSFPGNLDVTVKDGSGTKLGYLFFAINGAGFLKKMGTFGLVIDVKGEPVDVRFTATEADAAPMRKLSAADINDERIVLDVLFPKHDFQMIRPMILPTVQPGSRSQAYSLDRHPYEVSYTANDLPGGGVEFQSNLLRTADGKASQLLHRVYFHASSMDVLREAMYASKHFDEKDGVFKIVYYPAMGQTTPAKSR